MRLINNLKWVVLAAVVFGIGTSGVGAADPYLRNLESRRYWDAYDARVRESNMSMDQWMKSVVGGYGHKARPGVHVSARPTVRPTYTPGRLSPAAARSLAITQSKAARDAHNKALYNAALRKMGR
jgi:hypothetical protein